jgi:hypothetical protein
MNCFRSDLVNPEKEKVERMIERLKSTKGSELVKTCEMLAYEVFLPWLNKQNGMFDTIQKNRSTRIQFQLFIIVLPPLVLLNIILSIIGYYGQLAACY